MPRFLKFIYFDADVAEKIGKVWVLGTSFQERSLFYTG
jgi:hypothetical protein